MHKLQIDLDELNFESLQSAMRMMQQQLGIDLCNMRDPEQLGFFVAEIAREWMAAVEMNEMDSRESGDGFLPPFEWLPEDTL